MCAAMEKNIERAEAVLREIERRLVERKAARDAQLHSALNLLRSEMMELERIASDADEKEDAVLEASRLEMMMMRSKYEAMETLGAPFLPSSKAKRVSCQSERP